jgi:hypothetical protein
MPSKNKKRDTLLLGGYVPRPIFEAVQQWVGQSHERSVSGFVREAAREKLKRDGIRLQEKLPA